MTKVLVTGGAGMIGSNLVKKLVAEKYDVFVADNLWRGKIEYLLDDNGSLLLPPEKFLNMDLSIYANAQYATKDIDLVIHLADVVAGINFVFANQSFLWRKNITINSNVLTASIENNVKKYLYVGTACSYPLEKQKYPNPLPLREDEAYPANPESAYGWSKLMGEYEADLAHKDDLIDVGILRLHNVYGPPCELDPQKSQVIPALCKKACEYPSNEFIVWGSGKQRRAFLHVDDVVDGIIKLMNLQQYYGAIQIGPDHSTSITDLAEMIKSISNKKFEIKYDLNKPEGDFDRVPDLSKALKILGWKTSISIYDGLESTYRWVHNKLKNA